MSVPGKLPPPRDSGWTLGSVADAEPARLGDARQEIPINHRPRAGRLVDVPPELFAERRPTPAGGAHG